MLCLVWPMLSVSLNCLSAVSCMANAVNNLGLASHAWAIVDAFGCSQIGFWPIFIGDTRFVIAISGIPHFNQQSNHPSHRR